MRILWKVFLLNPNPAECKLLEVIDLFYSLLYLLFLVDYTQEVLNKYLLNERRNEECRKMTK